MRHPKGPAEINRNYDCGAPHRWIGLFYLACTATEPREHNTKKTEKLGNEEFFNPLRKRHGPPCDTQSQMHVLP